MVLLTTTPQILQAISLLPPSPSLDPTLPKSTTDPISHAALITLVRTLRSTPQTQAQPSYTLSALLRGTRPYLPPPPAPLPKSAEYLALRARLLKEKELLEYNALISSSGPSPNSLHIDNRGDEDDDDDVISPSLVVNILLSTLLCGFATWYVSYPLRNDGLRVLVGMLAAVVVAVAECVVYASYVGKVRQARRREREREKKKKGQKKVMMKGREENDDDVVLVTREEVWGRGVNGGARRRVRERWDREQEKEQALGQEKS